MACIVTYKGGKFFKDDFISMILDTLKLSDAEVKNNPFLQEIKYSNTFRQGDPLGIRKSESKVTTNEKVNQEGRQEGLLKTPAAEPKPEPVSSFSRKEKSDAATNIPDINDIGVFEYVKTYFNNLLGTDGGKGVSKYHGITTKSGDDIKIRVSDHSGNYENTGQYIVSIVIDGDATGDRIHIKKGENHTEIIVPDNKQIEKYIDDNISDILDEIETTKPKQDAIQEQSSLSLLKKVSEAVTLADRWNALTNKQKKESKENATILRNKIIQQAKADGYEAVFNKSSGRETVSIMKDGKRINKIAKGNEFLPASEYSAGDVIYEGGKSGNKYRVLEDGRLKNVKTGEVITAPEGKVYGLSADAYRAEFEQAKKEVLGKEPESVDEAIMQEFARGGRIKWKASGVGKDGLGDLLGNNIRKEATGFTLGGNKVYKSVDEFVRAIRGDFDPEPFYNRIQSLIQDYDTPEKMLNALVEEHKQKNEYADLSPEQRAMAEHINEIMARHKMSQSEVTDLINAFDGDIREAEAHLESLAELDFIPEIPELTDKVLSDYLDPTSDKIEIERLSRDINEGKIKLEPEIIDNIKQLTNESIGTENVVTPKADRGDLKETENLQHGKGGKGSKAEKEYGAELKTLQGKLDAAKGELRAAEKKLAKGNQMFENIAGVEVMAQQAEGGLTPFKNKVAAAEKAVKDFEANKENYLAKYDKQGELFKDAPKEEGAKAEPPAKELTPLEQAREKLSQAKAKAASLRDAGKLGTATDPFKQAAEQAKADRAMHEAYINLAVEYIKEYAKKGLDTLEEFAKYIGEPITDALRTAWDDAVNATNPKGVIGHAYNARNFSEQVKLKIVQLGLNYEPRSQNEAVRKADEFIKTIGVEDAVNQANNRSNDLNGDVRTMIIARAIEYWYDIEANAKTESAKAKAQEAQAELLDNLDMTTRDLGQEISALNKFYKTSPIGFEAYINKKEQRRSTQDITEKAKRGKSKLDIIRENKENLTTGAQQEAAKEVGKQAAKTKPSSISEKTKVLANNVRKLKTKPFKFIDENGVEYDVHTMGVTWNDLVEGVARTIEEAGELSEKASVKIKELAKEFPLYNKLSEADKVRFTEQLISAASKEIKDSAQRVKEITTKLEKAIATGNKAASDKAITELQQVSKEEGLWGQYRDLAARRIKNMAISSLLGDARRKPILQEFVDGLVKNMTQKINENLPQQKKTGKPKSSLEILSDAIKNQEKYKDVWEKAKAELEEKFRDSKLNIPNLPKDLSVLDQYFGELFDKPFSDKMLESAVKEGIKAEKIDIGKLAEDHFMAADATREGLVKKLIEQAELPPAEARKLALDLQQKFDKIVSEKRMEVLNRMFPQNRAKSLAGKVGLKLRQRENENIVKAINAGALDNTKFERLFYNKFGILDINTPEIQAKLKEFSKRLYNARNENNTLFYDRAMQDMVDYIEGKRKESWLRRYGSVAGSQMYANMLYGYETHIRNTSFNILKSAGSIASAMGSNPKYAGQFLTAFAKDLYRGKIEATAIMKEGYKKSGDPITDARGLSERVNNLWGKYTAVPFRMLSAMDAALNFPSRSMKTYQYLLEDAIKKNNELPEGQRKTKSEIIDEVNEQMGYDTISDMAAEAEALQQIKKEYGINDLWENGERKYKDRKYDRMYRDFERSVFNIKEAKRPEIAVEDAKDWADNALLMGKPKGWFGVVAHFLNKWGKAAPIAKILTTPFVNVPLNVAAHMVEFSPLGFSTIALGKEAWGLSRESAKHFGIEQLMTERRHKQLMAKAISGTVGMVAANALTQINYYDSDEKRVRPVMIIFADGLGSYNDNRKLENLVGSEKFKEYTVDFMGQRFGYKYSPFASWFLPSGAIHDYEKYHGGEDQKVSEKLINEAAYTGWKYITFVKDQAAVQGIADLFGFSASIPKNSTEDAIGQMIKDKTKDQVARIIRTLTVPNFIPQAMRDYKGLTDGIESGGYRFIDRLAKDVPFADQFVGKNEDHFGDPITSQFEIPSVVSERKPDNKYYQMAKDHDYLERLRFYSDRTLWINGENKILTNGQIDQINKQRNRIAGKEIKSRYYELNQMDNDDFRDEMNRIYREAEAEAKDKLLGVDGWSNTDPSKKKTYATGSAESPESAPEMETAPEVELAPDNN